MIRKSLGGHGNAHMGKRKAEDVGWIVEVHHMYFKASLFIMHD